jgi:hypothetical protein
MLTILGAMAKATRNKPAKGRSEKTEEPAK